MVDAGATPRDVVRAEDLDYSYYRSRGPGGQHKNKKHTAVRLRHRPTGIEVNVSGRKREKNKAEALRILKKRLKSAALRENKKIENSVRNLQVGEGERSEKFRTYNEKNDLAIDHESGKQIRLKKFLKGFIEELH